MAKKNSQKKQAQHPSGKHVKMIARNKQAHRNYEIDAEFEAGLVLTGSEVKSLRDGKASLNEAYCRVRAHEIWLVGAHIAEYKNAGYAGHLPTQDRKLLLHRREIDRIASRVIEKGYTLVPMELYWLEARVKLKVGLGKGKKLYDKRQDVADRDSKREIDRAMRRGTRRG